MTFKTAVKNFSIAFMAVALFMAALPAFAQQTVDPSGSCTIGSQMTVINGQTGSFACLSFTPGASTGTWVNIAPGLNARSARAVYSFAADGGAIATITPVNNTVIPANSIVYGVLINPSTALTSAGSATIAVGTSAGSATNSLKAATAVASYSIDALLAGTPVWTAATAFKMSAAGSITITVAVAALTAGVMEIYVFYVPSAFANDWYAPKLQWTMRPGWHPSAAFVRAG